jgi:hypothetical protein
MKITIMESYLLQAIRFQRKGSLLEEIQISIILELFRINSKVQRFVIIKSDMIPGHLGYFILPIQTQLMIIASLIKEKLKL